MSAGRAAAVGEPSVTTADRLVVAVDGPAGAGKSTVSRAVASRLRLRYLDTGATYRAVTACVLAAQVDPEDPAAVADLAAGLTITVGSDPAAPSVRVDGRALDAVLRGPAVSQAVSAVAAVPAVRRQLVELARRVIDGGGIVVEGRDIGTVVAPDAPVKVFLTAAGDVRLSRRADEGGRELAHGDVHRRDARDHRTTPLDPAPGAVVIDTSALAFNEVVDAVLAVCAATTGAELRR